jgi:tripeptide aminopeptidase
MFSIQHDVLDNFLTLVNIASESGNEKNIVKYLVKRLKQYTRDISVDNSLGEFPKGIGNVIAKIKGNKKYKPIMLCAHMDTVKPGIAINPQISNNIITSDGTTILGADDKAGIAAILTLLKLIHKDKVDCCPLEIVFTVSEECGLKGSKNLNFNLLDSESGYILDSDGRIGAACNKAPSYMYIKLQVVGKSAHSGMDPNKGIDAIKIASEAISKLKTGVIDNNTRINIGTIKGGTALNIVPELVELEIEIRSFSDAKIKSQLNNIKQVFKKSANKYKGKIKIFSNLEFKKYHIKSNSNILKIFKQACKNINVKPKLISSFGGSDANIFNNSNMDVLNIAVGYKKPHTKKESIGLSSLQESTELIYEIVKLNSV